jgi:Flp pilus assembly protein TadG
VKRIRTSPSSRGLDRDARGNVAVIAAIVVPVLSVMAVAAVELGFVMSDKGKLQAAVDAAALAAAHEMALAVDGGVTARAEALALAQVESLKERGSVTATAALVDDGTAVNVVLTSKRPSFFGNLLPPGGFTTSAEATAVGMGRTPLCILIDGKGAGDKMLNLLDQSRVRAPGCLVHSNKDIVVEGSGRVEAGTVQSVGKTFGSVSPEAQVGAERIEDPFRMKKLTTDLPCELAPKLKVITATKTPVPLKAGRHCQDILVEIDGKIRLGSGVHWFSDADLILSENAELTGKDVCPDYSTTNPSSSSRVRRPSICKARRW